ncbi:uncharacterized protein LOC135814697 isoform X2 [Sycon ciliatum]|uniref:uncharacterized protein LOC135814697 isoform X2 n=1 Tax=Sycon ciliatum TaxID=27933 RepID=UPI0031F63513
MAKKTIIIDSSRRWRQEFGNVRSLEDLFGKIKEYQEENNKEEFLPHRTSYEDVIWQEDIDGTIVDDNDYFLDLPSDVVLMACAGERVWQPEFKCQSSSDYDAVDGGDGDGAADIDLDQQRSRQDQYSAIIKKLLSPPVASSSPKDEPDGGRASSLKDKPGGGEAVDWAEAIYLLRDADRKMLAAHLGVSLSDADDIQLEAAVSIESMHRARDERTMRSLASPKPVASAS